MIINHGNLAILNQAFSAAFQAGLGAILDSVERDGTR